jgi:cbb3-type cytochrome oxidase cytochrome c subunit
MTRTSKLVLLGLVGGALGVGGSVAEAQSRVDANLATRGKTVWMRNGCYTCHGIGKLLAAPDLAGVTERRDHAWLRRWLKETSSMLQSDPQARAMLEQYHYIKMPQFKLSDADVDALLAFLAEETQRTRGS